MSENWQKGDLAMCVKAGVIETRNYFATGKGLRKGAVYLVLGSCIDPIDGEPILNLENDHGGDCGRLAYRFRKVTPPKADDFDREVIDLMRGKKTPANEACEA